MAKRQRRVDITGMKFGKLTVIEKTGYGTDKDGKRYALWLCKCECGNEKIVNQHLLVTNSVKSCGCLRKRSYDIAIMHGMSHSRIYHIFHGVLDRCNNPNDMHYADYGGRGIKVCPEWDGNIGFIKFYEWSMTNGYNDTLSIDRIDVNGDYTPQNCRWIPLTEQQDNKRNTKRYNIRGEILTIKEICKKYGMKPYDIYNREYKYNLTVEEAFELYMKQKGEK